jgi:hypothetical protein
MMRIPKNKKKSKVDQPDQPARQIHMGSGTYIEGDIHTGGGDFVGGNQNNISTSGDSADVSLIHGEGNLVNSTKSRVDLKELTHLLHEIKALVPVSNLDQEVVEVIQEDIKVVEKQLAQPEPKKNIVLPKLKSIAEALGTVVIAGEVVQKLVPMVQQAVVWASQLIK